MKRITRSILASGCIVVLATALVSVPEASSASNDECDSPRVKPVLDFTVGAAEGLALSRNGDVFAGNINTGEIWRAPRGDFAQTSLLADLVATESFFTFMLGMDVTTDGTLYVAVNALLDPSLHGLWKVERDGTAKLVAAFPAFFNSLLNDVAIDRRGNVYVSDSLRGAIWRRTPDGQLEVWSDSPLWKAGIHPVYGIPFGVNGLAYHEGALYGGITLNGRVVRVPIKYDGTAGEPEVVASDTRLVGADGIELDARGDIYVTVNDADKLVRIRAAGRRIETVLSEGLSAPASFAISSNQRVIYAANLSSSAPVPRPHAPAIVRATFCRSDGDVGDN